MTWTVERTDDAEAFASAVWDYLMRHEAAHNVALGVIRKLRSDSNPYSGDNFMAYVHSGDAIGGVALRTPPHPGLLSRTADDAAATRLVDALVDGYPKLDASAFPEQTAPTAVDRFESHGYGPEIGMHQRLFRTSEIEEPEGVDGSWRRANREDRALVAEWFVRFEMEAGGSSEEEAREKTRGLVEPRIDRGSVFLWTVDSESVSIAGYAGRTPNGVRIGYVYTPPRHRENGYASAVTAVASRAALEADNEYCCLYTDLANDTTNRIYPALGYEPVTDQYYYELTPPEPAMETGS